ncbi:MAG: hypothetical protein JWM44_3663 [Bacilli bacterium]|nr:hypothetical protein [Bacilli bacterium]
MFQTKKQLINLIDYWQETFLGLIESIYYNCCKTAVVKQVVACNLNMYSC